MTDYELYIFLLCLVVFVLLATLSISCICIIARLMLRLIDNGVEDQKILEEHKKKQGKKPKSKYSKIFDYAFSGVVCLVMLILLTTSLVIRTTEGKNVGNIPAYHVVNTGSMAEKNPKNTYLNKNKLDDQIQTFDLIKTEKLPAEKDLELYDIVVYETDGILIVHRIVGIEEPNNEHPNCRYFLLQGDAVDAPDRFPVLYEQMRAIYRGDRVPFIGSFVLFMQSPAGCLCVLYIILGMLAMPLVENKIEKAKQRRLMLYMVEEPVIEEAPETVEVYVPREIIPPPVVFSLEGKVGELTLDKLAKYFSAGDTVDLNTAKQKGLISKNCRRIKILAVGKLDKPLTVTAHSFSAKALTAIESAGGQAIKLNDQATDASPRGEYNV